MSHEKNPYFFPLYWLVNKDPYNIIPIYIYMYLQLGSIIPYITQPTKVFFIAHVSKKTNEERTGGYDVCCDFLRDSRCQRHALQ